MNTNGQNSNEQKRVRVVGAKGRPLRDDVALRKVARAVLAISKRQVMQRRAKSSIESTGRTDAAGADHVES